jgi:hypothetical protein
MNAFSALDGGDRLLTQVFTLRGQASGLFDVLFPQLYVLT